MRAMTQINLGLTLIGLRALALTQRKGRADKRRTPCGVRRVGCWAHTQAAMAEPVQYEAFLNLRVGCS